LVGTGFPDTNCCLAGVEVWIELKAPKEPKRKTTKLFGSNHKLSQAQKNWLLSQEQAGGRAFVYIETDKRRLLIGGRHGDEINELCVQDLMDISEWMSSRTRTTQQEWDRLRQILRGEL
jgi:hypothetical protein